MPSKKCLIGIVLSLLVLLVASVSLAQDSGVLTRLARGKTDKADTHGFTEIYDRIFSSLRWSPIRICEIGIAGGGSLHVWSQYFAKATIFGIDIYSLSELRSVLLAQGAKVDYLPTAPESARIKTFVANQADRGQLKGFIAKYGGDFDIILDDGGHNMDQQQISLGFFFKHVKPGRYYVIEDVHSSLPDRYPDFGAEKEGANTTLTMINYFIRHGQIKSQYLLPEEVQYLNENIEYCNLFCRNNDAHSITCILKKKVKQKAASPAKAAPGKN